MEITGQYRIKADRQAVWTALNAPEILGAAIPGCEKIDKISDTEFTATIKVSVGPVKVKLEGNATLEDLVPPESYTISGSGKGGAAGFAKGSAKVRLEEDGPATLLSYDVDVTVGGKLAQVGSRMIDVTAKKLSDEFFSRLTELIGDSEEVGGDTQPAPIQNQEGSGTNYRTLVWGVAVVAIAGLAAFILSN